MVLGLIPADWQHERYRSTRVAIGMEAFSAVCHLFCFTDIVCRSPFLVKKP
jgi:hypothetical protein